MKQLAIKEFSDRSSDDKCNMQLTSRGFIPSGMTLNSLPFISTRE